MKSNNLNRNNILIAIGALILFAVVAYYFFNRNTSTSTDLLASVPAGEVSGVEGDLLSTLRELKSLKLDDSVFTDPVFVRLIDFSKPLVSQGLPGRSNPFAPIGGDVTSFTSSQSATTQSSSTPRITP